MEKSFCIKKVASKSCNEQQFSAPLPIVPIFFAIVVFIGFFGNLLVVLVVTFNKQMRNTTNLGRMTQMFHAVATFLGSVCR